MTAAFTVETKRLAIEIIATLVHLKNTMARMILEPAGVPPEIYRDLLYKQDETTGRTLSKRQIAPLILNSLERTEAVLLRWTVRGRC